ncbi:undecaprenyl-phosphate glucose phosphotransferase [Curvibacter sp. APW13]|uniref:undecaprenyl-phosphate glucose phosphotransferase n=1 Tax=Curvibacter sp. APW13 TaxID=3077236 RepID=UPI0028DED771|nr:undecaprenyl-phosphate glucose phosphotransferase [Curvibacter sp. APW13]MDT8992584.1 undecaprenyl-phosphate glucose phosphotransferase [Curvibacter sp. APW13]
MTKTVAAHSPTLRTNVRVLTPGTGSLLGAIERLITPFALITTLCLITVLLDGNLSAATLLLCVLVFALSFPGQLRLQSRPLRLACDIGLQWLWIFSLLLLTGYATGYLHAFSSDVLWTWGWAAPLSELLTAFALRNSAPAVVRMQGPAQRAIIVGLNSQGRDFATCVKNSPYSRIELAGFVDERSAERLNAVGPHRVIGTPSDLATLVARQRIGQIYLSLPMASQPRILQILDGLKDTTASIYFLPDMFVTDLIQGHADEVCGMSVISVCETPFVGFNGFVKRASDVLLSLLILLLISPLMVGIAIAVKRSSPGAAIFKQRRYGLDGQEILVYKFRSMRTTDDGAAIEQATRNDSRTTPLGAFLRRTSLDELPQFINVLQGRMSIVGPRPHAVAHNEVYRKLIKGYMVRHKVKPGITGWAQVNGFRGETDTLDKMQGRIDLDLDYLRHWNLALDITIILKTIRLVLNDHKAY